MLADNAAPVLNSSVEADLRQSGTANWAFVDGHVSSAKPEKLTFYADNFTSNVIPVESAPRASGAGWEV